MSSRRLLAGVVRGRRHAGPGLRRMLGGFLAYSLIKRSIRVAVIVYAFDIGGVGAAGAAAFAMLLPAVVAAPLGRALHRGRAERALAAGYALQSATVLAAGIAVLAGAPLVVVIMLAAATTAALAVTRPLHQSMLPDVVSSVRELSLGTSATIWMDGIASIAGPLLVVVGLQTIGAGGVLLALAGIGALSVPATATLPVPRSTAGTRVTPPGTGRATAAAGAPDARRTTSWLRVGPGPLALTGLVGMHNAVTGAIDALAAYVIVAQLGGSSSEAGLLSAGVGVGVTLGAVGVSLTGTHRRMRWPVVTGALLCGLPLVLLGFAGSLAAAAGVVLVVGIGKSLLTISGSTLLQRSVPADSSHRVLTVQETFLQAGLAIGAGLGPLLATTVGLRAALIAFGTLMPALVAVTFVLLTRLDARAVIPGPLFDLLRKAPFLSIVPLRTIELLAREAREVRVPAGTAVCRQGDPGRVYYVVQEGTARVSVDGAPVRTLGPGDGFGEIALLRDTPRSATVTAVDDLAYVTISRDTFLEAVTGIPASHTAAQELAAGYLAEDRRRGAGPDASATAPDQGQR